MRELPEPVDSIVNLKVKNLYVSGCSFTYDWPSWPHYLQALGNIPKVVSCAIAGAGNHHILNSLVWTLENDAPDPNDTLVIVMWSGAERNDAIIDANSLNGTYPPEFRYNDSVAWGYSYSEPLVKNEPGYAGNYNGISKSKESKSVENYLYYTQAYHYLKSKGYQFVFLRYLDPQLPNRSGGDFSISDYLTKEQNKTISKMFAEIVTVYEYAVRHDMLKDDDFHPTRHGHLAWTREHLLPYLTTYLNVI